MYYVLSFCWIKSRIIDKVMGIYGPVKFTYKTKEFPVEDVMKALQILKETRGVDDGLSRRLCLNINANNIGYWVKKAEDVFQFAK
jgi:hypothetical protein